MNKTATGMAMLLRAGEVQMEKYRALYAQMADNIFNCLFQCTFVQYEQSRIYLEMREYRWMWE